MLSRAAGALFWTGRYLERADFLARLIEATRRFAAIPSGDPAVSESPWMSALLVAGAAHGFGPDIPDEMAVVRYLALDHLNPSSIVTCVDRARQNARATRTSLTAESWRAVNDLWLDSRRAVAYAADLERTAEFIERVKASILQFEGAVHRTQLKDAGRHFLEVGAAIERADNTARLLDVKRHLLLPSEEAERGSIDFFHWSTILRTVGAATAYRWVYHAELKPELVADLLLLNPRLPRSLASCCEAAAVRLDLIAQMSGRRGPAQRKAADLHRRLNAVRLEQVLGAGIHDFIAGFLVDVRALADTVGEQYGF